MNKILFTIFILTLSSFGTASASVSEGRSGHIEYVDENGYGGVTFGMSTKEAKSSFARGELIEEYWDEPNTCYYLCVDGTNCGVVFMVVDDTVQRLDVVDDNISTKSGVSIGTTLGDAEKIYRHSERKPNFYTYPEEDLVVRLSDKVSVIFEQGKPDIINFFRIGLEPAINFPEGCS